MHGVRLRDAQADVRLTEITAGPTRTVASGGTPPPLPAPRHDRCRPPIASGQTKKQNRSMHSIN